MTEKNMFSNQNCLVIKDVKRINKLNYYIKGSKMNEVVSSKPLPTVQKTLDYKRMLTQSQQLHWEANREDAKVL